MRIVVKLLQDLLRFAFVVLAISWMTQTLKISLTTQLTLKPNNCFEFTQFNKATCLKHFLKVG